MVKPKLFERASLDVCLQEDTRCQSNYYTSQQGPNLTCHISFLYRPWSCFTLCMCLTVFTAEELFKKENLWVYSGPDYQSHTSLFNFSLQSPQAHAYLLLEQTGVTKDWEEWQHGRQSQRIWHIHYNYSPSLNRPIDVLKSKQKSVWLYRRWGAPTWLTARARRTQSIEFVSYKWCIWLEWPFTRTQSKTVLNTTHISLFCTLGV